MLTPSSFSCPRSCGSLFIHLKAFNSTKVSVFVASLCLDLLAVPKSRLWHSRSAACFDSIDFLAGLNVICAWDTDALWANRLLPSCPFRSPLPPPLVQWVKKRSLLFRTRQSWASVTMSMPCCLGVWIGTCAYINTSAVTCRQSATMALWWNDRARQWRPSIVTFYLALVPRVAMLLVH